MARPRKPEAERRTMREGPTASRNGRVPALVGDAGHPAGRWSGNGSSSASKRLSAPFLEGLLAGSDLAAEGGWGCTSPSCPMPIEACRGGRSLPATASMAGSASPLRRPWHNRQRGSDIRNRRRVHRRRDFVSGDPRSTMYTRGSASVRAPGGQNGSPGRRLERHHGEDVGGRDAIVVRLRLGDNRVAGAAADMRAVTTLAGPSRASGPPASWSRALTDGEGEQANVTPWRRRHSPARPRTVVGSNRRLAVRGRLRVWSPPSLPLS